LGWGRPQIQGRARALSWAVATRVAWAISSESAKSCPASAWRRKIRHQPSCRFSQQAPLGMRAWQMGDGLPARPRVLFVSWLEARLHADAGRGRAGGCDCRGEPGSG